MEQITSLSQKYSSLSSVAMESCGWACGGGGRSAIKASFIWDTDKNPAFLGEMKSCF